MGRIANQTGGFHRREIVKSKDGPDLAGDRGRQRRHLLVGVSLAPTGKLVVFQRHTEGRLGAIGCCSYGNREAIAFDRTRLEVETPEYRTDLLDRSSGCAKLVGELASSEKMTIRGRARRRHSLNFGVQGGRIPWLEENEEIHLLRGRDRAERLCARRQDRRHANRASIRGRGVDEDVAAVVHSGTE